MWLPSCLLGVHLPGYLIDHGFDAATGTVFLALVGLFNIVGTMAQAG